MENIVTITFGDCAENHVGMQKIGDCSKQGFSKEFLETIMKHDKFKGKEIVLHDLRDLLNETEREKAEPAYLLVIKNGADAFVEKGTDDIMKEQMKLEVDKKIYSRRHGKVINKHARHNLCFAEKGQEADLENGKGTIIAFEKVPLLNKIHKELEGLCGDVLVAEGNYYYDKKKCYIGMHGDSERRKVIAMRLGASFPLHYQWYCNSKKMGKRLEIELEHGDIYIMSEKAVGTDWKKKKIYTLRHAAGLASTLKL